MPLSRAGFGRAALLLLSLGFLALLGLGFAIVQQVRDTRAFAADVISAQEARLSTLRVLSLAQDAETGQRGFLLTGEARYLEPYHQSVAALPPAMDMLAVLVAAHGGPPQHLGRLHAALDDKLAELAETITLIQSGDAEGALWLVRTDRGKRAMDAAREAAAEIEASITVRLQDREAALQGAGRRLLRGTVGALGLILAIAGITGALGWRYTRALEAAANEVRAANEGLESRVAERTADLVAANEEIQRFAYIVSHDLRAPLVNVMGFTSELETVLPQLRGLFDAAAAAAPAVVTAEARALLDAEIPESLSFIRSSTERMDRLINAILRLSRTGTRTLTPERIDMHALIGSIAATTAHQLTEAGATLTIEGALPTITADRLALEQVFGNLIDNAAKYLEPGRPGRVVVRGRVMHGRGGARAVFEVEDNGRGVAPADHQRIFDLFRRAGRQDRPGDGIGLAHVRALVRRMAGTIACDSTLGRGSLFRVTLPVTAALPAEKSRAGDTAGSDKGTVAG